jgi:hypothetical protein
MAALVEELEAGLDGERLLHAVMEEGMRSALARQAQVRSW